MDPLAISSSITGLLSLGCSTAAKLDALFRDFKARPAVLAAISQEISALCLVLGQLEGQLRAPNSSGRGENEKTLSAVLDLCMGTFQQIGSQISELQSSLRKGSLSKAYSFMLYPSRMKEISALRDDLEKYKVTLLIALQMHKPTDDSSSLEALRQEVEQLRSKMLEVHQPSFSVDLERMDVIKNYIAASSTTLFGKNATQSSSGAVIQVAGVQKKKQESQVGLTTALPPGDEAASDVPTFGSFNDWLSTFAPNPEIPDPKEDELLSAFRNRKNTHSVNNETQAPPVAIDTIEVASQAEMILTSDTLSLISQHLPIRQDIPDGKVHLIFVNLRRFGSDTTFTEDLVTSPDIPLYKVIHELHLKGYTKICGFQTVDRQSTYGPMIPHDSLLPVVVSAGSSNYSIPSGLQIDIDERLIDFYNRFVLDDPATSAEDLISVKRRNDSVHIYDSRFNNNLHLKLQRTLRVPEDGKSYPLPAYFGEYPLCNVETFSDRLPLHMRQKGGLFFPMFQREALSLDFGYASQVSEERFAIRIHAGSINAISGKEPKSQVSEGEQDYIVVPKQRRLDGFLAGKGVVKQFVAMPLGFGYSVEKQVTGKEFIGGIQLEIIPRLSDKVKFIRPQRNISKLSLLPQQLDTSEDIFRTPRELGMATGQLLLMQDGRRLLTSRRMKFDLGFLKDSVGNARQDLLPVYEEMCRPVFVYEMFLGTGQHSYSTNESLVLHPMEPLSLRVDWQAIMLSPKGTIVEEYSPFLHISDFKKRITSIKMKSEPRPWRTGYILFDGTVHKGYPTEYSPLTDYVSEGGIVSWKVAVLPRNSDQASEVCGAPARFPARDPSWEMALGAGGNLGQNIEKTKDGRLWDWGASKLINIQILNSLAFKEFTGVSPVTPISFREYVTAKIPFYSFLSVSEDSVIGDNAPTFKSIGQLDHSAVIQIGIRVDRSGKPVGCANCENNICDTILQPCKHTFCSDCIKLTMATDSSITCVFCSGPVTETIAFSAPMEMPSSIPNQSTEPDTPLREEDKIREISSRKSTSDILDNLIMVLLEMVKDGESPKDIPTPTISDLVADSITVNGWGYTIRFDMAVRNLMQTGIDIRIPIFKAGLPKAIKSGTLHHVKQLLLLVPNVDDLVGQDTEFVGAAINETASHKSFFTILFKWLTSGRRSIEDLGLSVSELLKLVRFNDAVDMLLKFVADRKQTLSEYGVSVFTVGNDETYKTTKLIEYGCDPNHQNAEGKTLLHLNVHSAKSIETFLSLGSRIDITDNDGNTSIHLVVAVPKSYSGLGLLLRHKSCTPAIINIRNREGLTAYHLSLKLIPWPLIRKWFLDAGADPNMEMPKGRFRDEVVAMLRKIDWVREEYVLDDGLNQELQGPVGE